MNLLPGADVSSGQIESETEAFAGTGNKNNFIFCSNKIENPEMDLFPQRVGFDSGKSVVTETKYVYRL
jgi:hypothetical protein